MKALVFVPDQDSPGKRDMSAAFYPEARAFCKVHGLDPVDVIKRFPAHAPLDLRRMTCTLAIKATPDAELDTVAWFCHGWKAGIQAGFARGQQLMLARLIAKHAKPDAHVLLYCCETGSNLADDDDRDPGPGGDGGFADAVRDACEVLGRSVTVMGHTTTGHTTQNPHARYFAPGCGGQGGHWYVEPGSKLWLRWKAALRDPRNTLRYRFWQLTPEEIAAELLTVPGPLVG